MNRSSLFINLYISCPIDFIRKQTISLFALFRFQIAVYIGFAIFLLGWIMQTVVIFGVPYTPSYYGSIGGFVTVFFSLFPWSTLAKGVQDLSSAAVTTSSPGTVTKYRWYFPIPHLITLLL